MPQVQLVAGILLVSAKQKIVYKAIFSADQAARRSWALGMLDANK